MTETQTHPAKEAEQVLKNLDLWKLPVCPFEIARKEGIELLPGSFSDGFDGRIRYVPEISSFVISFRKDGPGRTKGRVRFTLAPELGHYFLHRDYLLSEQCHSSKSNFTSKEQMEVEADQFASSLLMPMDLFRSRIKFLRSSVADLGDLVKLANNEFQTSITSTVLRYCSSDIEPCGMIVSRKGKVCWCRFSEDMKYLRMGYYGNLTIPIDSVTATQLGSEVGIVSDAIEPWTWFENTFFNGKLWEEAMSLGRTGYTLTYLTRQ